MTIRPEKLEDKSRIATLIAQTYAPEGAKIIEQTGTLRTLDSYAESIALVDDGDDGINAFAMLTPVKAGAGKGVYLAPLAFDAMSDSLDLSAFLNTSFEKAAAGGFRYVFLQGTIDGLKEFGFAYASDSGFNHSATDMLVKDLGAGTEASGDLVLPAILEE